MTVRHFLTLLDCSASELQGIISRAIEMKTEFRRGQLHDSAFRKAMTMIFDKSSTRTRLSFEAGMTQLGGHAINFSPKDSQLGRGESIEDSARVISSMSDLVMIRTYAHKDIELFAEYSNVPVINALTDQFHPCQLLADMQTYQEHRGSISGKKVAWIGDGNNMCHSYINAANRWNFELHIATPDAYQPDSSLVSANSERVQMTSDPKQAARNADLIVTDTWASMGQEQEKTDRENAFPGFIVNHELMSYANSNATFMHCLPAYRGSEVSHELMEDSSVSLVFPEAENRLHAQKALIEFLLQS